MAMISKRTLKQAVLALVLSGLAMAIILVCMLSGNPWLSAVNRSAQKHSAEIDRCLTARTLGALRCARLDVYKLVWFGGVGEADQRAMYVSHLRILSRTAERKDVVLLWIDKTGCVVAACVASRGGDNKAARRLVVILQRLLAGSEVIDGRELFGRGVGVDDLRPVYDVSSWLRARHICPGGRFEVSRDATQLILEATQVVKWPGMHGNSSNAGYVYDDAGNLVTVKDSSGTTNIATYTYTPDGLLETASYNGRTLENTWDADRNRVGFSVTVGSTATPHAFVYDITAGIPAVIVESDGSGTVYYVRDPSGGLLARVSGTSVSYYHFDQLGSTRMITNASGAVTDKYAYDAWGNLDSTGTWHHSTLGTTDNPYQYVGRYGYYTHYQEPTFKLLQLGVRFYDAEKGRFTQRDTIRRKADAAYYYAADNPSLRVDVDGREDQIAPTDKSVVKLCYVEGLAVGTHTFMCLDRGCWGFHPNPPTCAIPGTNVPITNPWAFISVPGHVEDDSGYLSMSETNCCSVWVSAARAQRLRASIAASQKSPGRYRFVNPNRRVCHDWVRERLVDAGLLPFRRLGWRGLPSSVTGWCKEVQQYLSSGGAK